MLHKDRCYLEDRCYWEDRCVDDCPVGNAIADECEYYDGENDIAEYERGLRERQDFYYKHIVLGE